MALVFQRLVVVGKQYFRPVFFIFANLSLLAAIPMHTAHAQATAIEEIVVTAQYREQRIQDIPISMQAFSGEDLLGMRIHTPKDLASIVPGLFMNESSLNQTDPEFTLRGIGTNSGSSNQNPTLPIYVGGIAVPYNGMIAHALFDMERIEVLKGPQGTLYGRNTTGGAVNFIPRRPGPEWGGYISASYGNRNITNVEGAVDIPVGESLVLRAAGVVALEDGWQTIDNRHFFNDPSQGTRRRNGDIDRNAFRLSSLWQPTSDIEVLTAVDAGWDDSQVIAMKHAGNVIHTDPNTFCSFALTGVRDETQCASFGYDNTNAVHIPVHIGGYDLTVQPLSDRGVLTVVSDLNPDPRTTIKEFGIHGDIDAQSIGLANTINWNLERMTLTSVTGYRNFQRTTGIGQQGGPFKTIGTISKQNINVVTQEIRIASDDSWGAFNWVVGGYYSEEGVYDLLLADLSEHHLFSTVFHHNTEQQTDSIAGFGQVEWDMSEQIQLVAGIRYTSESRDFQQRGHLVGTPLPMVMGFEGTIDGDQVTWKAGVNYRPNEDWLVYASVATGFRGQSFPASISFGDPDQFQAFEEENIIAYEGGFKSLLLDGRLRFNAAAYYYDWEDFQASTGVDVNEIRLIILGNAGDVEIFGVEAEVVWSPTAELSFYLGANYVDSDIVAGTYEGDTTARTPEITLNGMLRYDSEKSYGPFQPFAQFDFSYTDDVEFQLPNHPGSSGYSYWLANASVGAKLPDQNWEVSFWMKNIGDRLYRTEAFGAASTFLPAGILWGSPQTYGASVSYSF